MCVQKQVERKVVLNHKMLQDKLDEIRGAVMICYPMGLPQWDPVRSILDGEDDGSCSVRFMVEHGSQWFLLRRNVG